jgi:bla regulator protein blaR1
MSAAIANHLWQSSVVTLVAAVLALMLRRNGAHVRYWIWFAASLKFLVPLSLLITLGSELKWRTPLPLSASPSIVLVAAEMAQPFATSQPPDIAVSASTGSALTQLSTALAVAWAAGCSILVFSWMKKWRRMHAFLKSASSLKVPLEVTVMSSPVAMEPGVFGIFRPVLLLPQGIHEHLSEEHLRLVLGHEMCHIRRRDNLLSFVHMSVAAIFWFYPVVWWLGTRLLTERERAWDEQMLGEGSDPRAYAEAIVRVSKFYLESPLQCSAGVGRSNLQRRIEAIIANRTARKLDFRRTCALLGAAMTVILGPIAFGIVNVPARSQILPPQKAVFEVVSIKRSPPDAQMESIVPQPARFVAANVTARDLVRFAFFAFHPMQDSQLVGGPGWLASDKFDVQATANRPLSWDESAAALRTALEDRFGLRSHTEKREMPVYALTVDKGGPKMKAVATPPPLDTSKAPEPPPPPGAIANFKPLPGRVFRGNGSVIGTAISMETLIRVVASLLDRPVIDKTNLEGHFDIRLQFTPDLSNEPGPSLFTAVQEQLGLTLESTKGVLDVVVIDSAEKPSEN